MSLLTSRADISTKNKLSFIICIESRPAFIAILLYVLLVLFVPLYLDNSPACSHYKENPAYLRTLMYAEPLVFISQSVVMFFRICERYYTGANALGVQSTFMSVFAVNAIAAVAGILRALSIDIVCADVWG